MRVSYRAMLILSASASLLNGQAMVEYGVSAGRVSAAGAGLGKSVTKTLGRLDTVLAGAAKADETPLPKQSAPAAAPAIAAAAPAPSAPPVPINVSEIVVGMEKADLLKKAGKPSMTMTSMESSTTVETCWYKTGVETVTVILRNGKVASISGLEQLSAK